MTRGARPVARSLVGLVVSDVPRQRLRVVRSLQASVVYAICSALILYGVWTNVIASHEGALLVACIFASCVIFYALLRSGLSRRYSDPSLTLPQTMTALTWSAATYGIANEAHGGVLLTAAMVAVFGVFNMSKRRAFIASFYGVAAFGAVMFYKALTEPDVYPVHLQFGYFLLTLTILPTINGFALALSKLRRTIQEQKAELRVAMQRFASHGEQPLPRTTNAEGGLDELWQQFAELAKQRRDLDEQRSTMLAAISHDLRSPLGRIRVAAELLPDAQGVAVRREAIVRNVSVANRLLGHFIDMARADWEPIEGRADLRALLSNLYEIEPSLQLVDFPNQPQWLQPASAVALERALYNVVDNAKKHGAPPIEIGLHTEQGKLVLWVRDHGPGVDATLHEEMLKPFVRGEFARMTPGTGLGLSIVERTIVRHGGSVTLKNAYPGLCVQLSLPIDQPIK